MDRQSFRCRACGTALKHAVLLSYTRCNHCGSYNYIAQTDAEADNSQYFNGFYADDAMKPIGVRQTLYNVFMILYNILHRRHIRLFNNAVEDAYRIIVNADKCLEIGFGDGTEMIQMLARGARMYGIDLSEEAVIRFQARYPQYEDRVSAGTNIYSQYDVIYSNALFEHIDRPGAFLSETYRRLCDKGILIMRLPVAMHPCDSETARQDINFWKPCHRILYTQSGLNRILANHGFRIYRNAHLDYYGYRVMSTLLTRGYQSITVVRNPFFPIEGLRSMSSYISILVQGLFSKIVCSDCIVFAEKAG